MDFQTEYTRYDKMPIWTSFVKLYEVQNSIHLNYKNCRKLHLLTTLGQQMTVSFQFSCGQKSPAYNMGCYDPVCVEHMSTRGLLCPSGWGGHTLSSFSSNELSLFLSSFPDFSFSGIFKSIHSFIQSIFADF